MHQPSFRGVVAALSHKAPELGLGATVFGARLLIAFALPSSTCTSCRARAKGKLYDVSESSGVADSALGHDMIRASVIKSITKPFVRSEKRAGFFRKRERCLASFD
jgi:hypothetical protein